MARATLDRKIRHLLDEVLVLDSLVESALIESVDGLKRRDLELSRRVYAGDIQINTRRFELENEIIITIATTQPVMAGDLRLISSILEVVGELERIGDYAKGIAKIAIRMGAQPPVKPLIEIPQMVAHTVDMLHRSITAFVSQDAELASQIPPEDDLVDALYESVYRQLVSMMLGDPTTIDRANSLLWVAHNLERAADRVTNICERTVYTATGQLMEFAPSDDQIVGSRTVISH